MNTVGWAGASLAPLAIGKGADHFGLGRTIASMAAIYAIAGMLAVAASYLVMPKPDPGGNRP